MRLLTRADFDGLACAAILRELGIIDSWKFVHPKDVQDGRIQAGADDVLANVPYAPGCKMWFDHHSSERERLGGRADCAGASRPADSAARVIYDYYQGETKLPRLAELVAAVDKVDSAKLTAEEIQNPSGWVLLGFLMDPRTGLGRFRDFRLGNFELIESLIDACRSQTIDRIFANPDIQERVKVYREQDGLFREMLKEATRTDANVIITDLRGRETIYAGNRFLIYSLYPGQNISLWAVDGKDRQNCPLAVGHSVINRTSKTNVGALMLQYGGGGHRAVGTCQVPYDQADRVMAELVDRMKRDG
ncbi:MAG: exopolyphosphatase [Planctomycetota bacterium]|jgi:nanoRNase/pAp phosphatase (c-di-AMP/oligoRNAs hydrolase)|nr:exopolyphosphatase [Planctomycetota bacterium]